MEIPIQESFMDEVRIKILFNIFIDYMDNYNVKYYVNLIANIL